MEKKYQVFVSSTCNDLREERSKVMQTLMDFDCIPAGMELFPALDQEQHKYIKKAIDACDYYILIVGGRYGSLNEDNISYTEMEFDYAVSKRKPVLALLHGDSGNIPVNKTDQDEDLREKLNAFRNKVKTGRLVKFWTDARDLPGQVALGMNAAIKAFPATGWIRGDRVRTQEDFEVILKIEAENKALVAENNKLKKELEKRFKNESENELIEDVTKHQIAGLQDEIELDLKGYGTVESVLVKWSDLFRIVSTSVELPDHRRDLRRELSAYLSEKINSTLARNFEISENSFQTVIIQFRALGLLTIDVGQFGEADYSLTSKGEETMLGLLAVRKIRN